MMSKPSSYIRLKSTIKSKMSDIKDTFRAPWPKTTTLAIEVAGVCNLRCPMCSYPYLKRPKGFMDWSLFEKIVSDAKKNGHKIGSLHFFGEPLMWPRIVDAIGYLAKRGFYPRISTNGMLFTGELARQFQDAGMKEIMVAIDTLKPKAYPKIRTGGKLSVVIQNIHDALDAAPDLLISAQLMPSKYNADETEEDFYKEFGRRSNFRVEKWFVIRMQDGKDISQGFSYQPDDVDKRLCRKIFDRIDVLWDGTTVLCCLDAEGTLITGNLKQNSISYSWIGPKAMAIRKTILEGKYDGLEACKKCAADHVVTETPGDRWRVSDPPKALPLKQGQWLREIQKLKAFDSKTGTWSKK